MEHSGFLSMEKCFGLFSAHKTKGNYEWGESVRNALTKSVANNVFVFPYAGKWQNNQLWEVHLKKYARKNNYDNSNVSFLSVSPKPWLQIQWLWKKNIKVVIIVSCNTMDDSCPKVGWKTAWISLQKSGKKGGYVQTVISYEIFMIHLFLTSCN